MAEKRLIDANALLEKADWYEEYNEITGEEISFRYIAASDAEEAPTVDAVEVCRCKDCKYNRPEDAFAGSNSWCGYWAIDPTEDGFCSRGERRADGNL